MSQGSLLDWSSYWREIRPSENKTWFCWLNLLQEGVGTLWHFGTWKNRNQGLEKKQGKCKATTVKATRTNQSKIKVFTFLLYYSMHLRAEGEHQATDIYFDTEISDQYFKNALWLSQVLLPNKTKSAETLLVTDWRGLYQSLLSSWRIWYISRRSKQF